MGDCICVPERKKIQTSLNNYIEPKLLFACVPNPGAFDLMLWSRFLFDLENGCSLASSIGP